MPDGIVPTLLRSHLVNQPERLAEAAARVREKYGLCGADFSNGSPRPELPATDTLGIFIELAELGRPYLTGLGIFTVSQSEGYRTLFQSPFGQPRRAAIALNDGRLLSITNGRVQNAHAWVLLNWIRCLLLTEETFRAYPYLNDWGQQMASVLNVGDSAVYRGEHRGKTFTGRFVVTERGDGGKDISALLPFRPDDSLATSRESLVRLSRVRPRQARDLFRFLSTATVTGPRVLVTEAAKSSTRALG